ncbi:response regulator [Paenibacillus thalictri]|nr:response regulator [Paenibacillus thalictri]
MLNILVVDDEKTIRDGIVRSLSDVQERYRVAGEAENGEKALELVTACAPDIIITDINMPRMNGLDFIENVKALNPNVKMIIISGYDEFDFAQRALKLGVSEYLLKPLDRETLLEAVGNVCAEVEKSNRLLYDMEKLTQLMSENMPAARERFLNKLITGKRGLELEEAAARAEYLQMDLSGELYTLVLMKIISSSPSSPHPDDPAIDSEEFILSFIQNAWRELFDRSVRVHPFFFREGKIGMLVCSQEPSRSKVFTSLHQSLGRMAAHIERNFGLNLFISVGNLYDRLASLPECCKEADEALHYSTVLEQGAIVHCADVHLRQEKSYGRPVELEKKLIVHLKLCERAQAFRVIDELFRYYASLDDGGSAYIKMMVFELSVMLVRVLDESLGTESLSGLAGKNLYGDVFHCAKLNDLHTWLLRLAESGMAGMEELHRNKHASLIEKVKSMMAAYMDEPELSVEFLAERLYISPNYLRHLFKKQVGASFVETLTRLRMEQAMEMLADPTVKIQDIAERVGFNDSRYFAFCFKKYSQLTPSEYREMKQLE